MYIVYCVGVPVQTCKTSKDAYRLANTLLHTNCVSEVGLCSRLNELDKSYEHNPKDFGVMGYVWVQKLKVGDNIEQ